jgi:hypothetical protein
MPELFWIERNGMLQSAPLRDDAPLRLVAGGLARDGEAPLASLVPFVTGSTSQLRFALVVRPDADIWIGAMRVPEVAEVEHGDRVFVGLREYVVSLDALPAPVEASAAAPCPVCCEEASADDPVRACPRCGARACARCWSGARDSRCLTHGCDQPAALERELWRPEPEHFVSCDLDGFADTAGHGAARARVSM